jgi:hypothetical protein
MTKKNNIDLMLRRWKYNPETVTARLVEADDGRCVIQMRIDMGILQMEVVGRPDGAKVDGMGSWLDRLGVEAIGNPEFFITESQKSEIDREFSQYCYRRLCWLTLHEFEQAILDADHTLMLMDFIRIYSNEPDWVASHEQHRPFVVFQRTEAIALRSLEEDCPKTAVEEINSGLNELEQIFQEWPDHKEIMEEIHEMIHELQDLRSWIQEHYMIKPTLQQQLKEAIAAERYELAAELRDLIRGQINRGQRTENR